MTTPNWDRRFHCVAVGFAAFFAMAAGASAPAPEYWPTCTSPQNIGPLQNAGGVNVQAVSPLVWNGQDYAVAWVDGFDARLHFRRFFADGTPNGAGSIPSARISYVSYPTSLVWNGSGYAVAWTALSSNGYPQAYFTLLNPDGSLNGTEVKASFYGGTDTVNSVGAAVAWNGSRYAVTWYDARGASSQDIYATILDSTGTAVVHDLAICTAANNQIYPCVAWSRGGNCFVLAWQDYRTGTKNEIFSASISPTGSTTIFGPATVTGAGNSSTPALADSGNGLGMAWYDSRDGNNEIYFRRLNTGGGPSGAGPELRMTNDGASSQHPTVVWTGAEYGVFWEDSRGSSGSYDLWFQRVSASGALAGAAMQVTVTTGTIWPAAAFAQYGYLVSGNAGGAPNFLLPLGCSLDTTAPTCPESLMAYNITGTTATVSWLPSIEDATDLAFYQLYRNNALIAKTSSTYYADSGLSLSTTYKYDVRAVNAAGLVSGGCGSASSLYLKTNATLLLMLNKNTNGTDADLTWTDAQMNFYNVFKSTDPRVFQQVGSTGGQAYTDPDVLMDGNIYFYTVDEPGQ